MSRCQKSGKMGLMLLAGFAGMIAACSNHSASMQALGLKGNAPQTIPSPPLVQGRVTHDSIAGQWKSECIQHSPHGFWIQELTFQGASLASETQNFSDSQCQILTSKELRISKFDLNAGQNQDVFLIETPISLEYLVLDAGEAGMLNHQAYCGYTAWKAGKTEVFSDPGVCKVNPPDRFIAIFGGQVLELKSASGRKAISYRLQ